MSNNKKYIDNKLHIKNDEFPDYVSLMNNRLNALEDSLKINLKKLSDPVFDVNEVSTKHCENLVGKVEIPLGVAGPLSVHGDYAKGKYYIPLATTEGALVASVNRGCKAVMLSGGARVYIEKSGITRAPVFKTRNLEESRALVDWVNKHIEEIRNKVKETSPFINLTSIQPFIVGRNVYLRFIFDTADAMGMNMATFACDHAINSYITYNTKIPCISLSGNVCTDKKAAWLNKIEGRGYTVHAEALIQKKVLKEVLKTEAEEVAKVYKEKILLGTVVSGSIGANAHHANIIAAIYAATGQDLAHIVEGSMGTTYIDSDKDDLYIAVMLPSLVLGTLGGGTNLASQKVALSIMGVGGGGKKPGENAKKLAEIVASAVLCGELSLISALASNDLARAHKKYGRGEKV